MRYFTKEYFSGEYDDKTIDRIEIDYENSINAIFMALPFPLKVLTKTINFHDGLIENIAVDLKEKHIVIQYLLGDKQIGYFRLSINYSKTENLDLTLLKKAAEKKPLEILADEISEKNTAFKHQLIFSNKQELSITFKEVAINLESCHESDYFHLRKAGLKKFKIKH